jgi:hypothetical protein
VDLLEARVSEGSGQLGHWSQVKSGAGVELERGPIIRSAMVLVGMKHS